MNKLFLSSKSFLTTCTSLLINYIGPGCKSLKLDPLSDLLYVELISVSSQGFLPMSPAADIKSITLINRVVLFSNSSKFYQD